MNHLSNDQIIRLMNDYYESDYSATELIKEYKLNITPNQLYKSFPPLILLDGYFDCPYDGSHLLIEHNSRAMANREGRITLKDGKCPKCGHVPFGDCQCKNCHRVNTRVKTDQLIYVVSSERQTDPIELKQLTAKDRLYLAAVLRGFMDKNGIIHGFNTKTGIKSILSEYDYRSAQIFKRLDDIGAITISLTSNLAGIHLDENNQLIRYDLDFVNYDLNIQNPFKTKKEFMNELMYPDRKYFLRKKKACINIWKLLALDECKMYLNFMINSVLFDDFSMHMIVNTVIKKLLDNFSQGQVFYIIYNEVTQADKENYLQQNNYNKSKVITNIINKLSSYGKNAKDDHMNLRHYYWPRDIFDDDTPVYINEVFFTDILQIPLYGVEKVPNETISNIK